MLRKVLLLVLSLACAITSRADTIRFVYVSDSHYGLFRTFRGKSGVSSEEVNRAMIERINQLPQLVLPHDGGVCAGTMIGSIDFVANTGDIANRMEKGVQTAARSWSQFEEGWYTRLNVRNDKGEHSPLYTLPGNHDATNAVGFYKPMTPQKDATSMVRIYNSMMRPSKKRTVATFDYVRDKVRYSFNLKGVHFIFAGIWPDSPTRRWISHDLQTVGIGTPSLLLAHDQPDIEAKHLINPNGQHDINAHDRFENLLEDTSSVTYYKDKPMKERMMLARFFADNGSIKAYFHGNENFTEYYSWSLPEGNRALPVFRVDSPMKGEYSSADDKKLSFLFVCIDTGTKEMTVRECLWNRGDTIQWGQTTTVSIK